MAESQRPASRSERDQLLEDIEKYLTPRDDGNYCAGWDVIKRVKKFIAAQVSERLPLPNPIRGEWTPRRCLHLGEASEIEALCKFLNDAQRSERKGEGNG